MHRLIAWLLLIVLVLPAFQARADNVDDAYDKLSASALVISPASFDSVRQGIEQLAVSGDPRAAVVIGALRDGMLYTNDDHALFIQLPDGSYVDARTGAKAPDVTDDDVKAVRVNNAVRSAIDAALGSLQLFAPDAPTRLQAAAAVFTSHDPAALPALAKALANEKNPEVKRRMQQAQAAALLSAPAASQADKLAAVAILRARGDQDSRGLLARVAGQPGPVGVAAAAAVVAIDRILQIWSLAQSVYYGISLGSVLLLAAAGLAITFGVMGVINMAHGEMVMIGAYVTFVVQQLMHAYLPSLYGISLLVAVPMAFLVSGGVGVVVERGLIRFLYGRPLETLLATWGLSLVLQQVVRSLFGANNKDVDTPSWMSGAFQLGGLTLTWNRLYIIVFAFLVVAALMAALRYTPLGLRMRAVTQNRRMAAAMGIRTPWIDALTFGLGSGIAGIAGVALSQIDNVSPNLGQGYIIDSFMVVVFGGVGNLWGTTLGALTLGIVNKFLEPIAGAVLGKIIVLVLLILFVQRNPRGMFPLKGRAVGGMRLDRTSYITLVAVIGAALVLALLNQMTAAGSAVHVPTYVVALAGKYLCFAMLALAVDLVWGFAGILSLGHAAFFALGGYAMGMYLMRQIGTRGVYGNAMLPDFMVFLGWKELPWYWHGFEWFGFAMLMAVLVPALLAGVFGWLAFRSRVTGVYLSIITQALTYALLLAFFRNDMGFGGNNGMTDFKDILGFNVQADSTRSALLVISALVLCGQFLLARFVVDSRFGKILIAVRDTESRTRFLGYRPESYKLVVWVLSAVMAGIGGALYVPQVGIINPSEFAPGNSIEAVIWVAVGGRGTLVGAILGAILVNFGKTWFTGALPEIWLYALGAMFIFVTLFMPRGVMGLFRGRQAKEPEPEAPAVAAAHEVTG